MIAFHSFQKVVEDEFNSLDHLIEDIESSHYSFVPYPELNQGETAPSSQCDLTKAQKEEGATDHSQNHGAEEESEFEHQEVNFSTEEMLDESGEDLEEQNESDESEEFEVHSTKENSQRQPRRPKKPTKPTQKGKKIKKTINSHPINNFLPAFRGFINKYLKEKMSSYDFSTNLKIKEWNAQPTVTKKMFEEVFKDKPIRIHLKPYFAEKRAYTDLMLSRIAPAVKINYASRIVSLEKAFKTKVFKSIL